MASFTPNYNLRKPAGSDPVSVTADLNENWDKVDAHAHSGTYEPVAFATVAALLASTNAARGTGARWVAGPYEYVEAASGASDHHVTTAGGVKLYVVPVNGAVHLSAWGVTAATVSVTGQLLLAATAAEKIILPADTTLNVVSQPTLDADLIGSGGSVLSMRMLSGPGLEMAAGRQIRNVKFTSPYTGPASALDAVDAGAGGKYDYGSRGLRLNAGCHIEDVEIEYTSQGIHVLGAGVTGKRLNIHNIRHYKGWGAAIHRDGAAASYSHFEDLTITNTDRGIETEASASYNLTERVTFTGVGPTGYTGQPGSYETYTFLCDAHSHVGEGACVGNVYRDIRIIDCMGGITCVRSDGSNDSDLPRDNVFENVTIEGYVGTAGYEAVYLQGHNNRVRNLRLKVGSGVTSKMRAYIANGKSSGVDIGEAAAYALPLVTGTDTAEDAHIRLRRVSAPTTGTGYLLDLDSPYTVIDAVIESALGTTGYLNLDDSAHGSATRKFRYTVHASETFTQVIRLNGVGNAQLDGIRGVNNVAAVKDIATAGGVANGYARGYISRSAAAVSVELGGASTRFDTSRLDTTLGTISDVGGANTNSRQARHGVHDFVATLVDPSYAARVVADSTATPITWPTANQGIGVKVRVGRRSSLTRFRFKVVTQAGNYYAAVSTAAGLVLWKTQTTVPAAGIVSLTISGVEVEPGDMLVIWLALSSTTAAVAGLTVDTGDVNLLSTVNNNRHAVAVTNLYTTNTAVGGTITLGSTLPAFIPVASLIEV